MFSLSDEHGDPLSPVAHLGVLYSCIMLYLLYLSLSDEHDDPLSPAAHLGVLYSGQDDADGCPGSQHSLCLPALPGTPVVDTAGYSSSGSSSGSSKGLLPLSLSNTSLDDKPVV